MGKECAVIWTFAATKGILFEYFGGVVEMSRIEEIRAYEQRNKPFELDVVRFLLNGARNGNFNSVDQLIAAAQAEFPICDQSYIRSCLARIGRNLDDE